ncbi:hypothetical protein E0L36_26630 [Streptomyces sp. AJS327]|nr:hypothetical protein [Streptomyces sp. AJS327]
MKEAESQYTALELETRAGKPVKLRNLLMLPEAGLASARVILAEFADGDQESDLDSLETIVPRLRDLLLLVADAPAALKKEIEDWPMGMYVRVVDAWQEETQVGEAPGSDN